MPMSNVQRTIAYNCAKIHRIKTPTRKNKNIVFLCHPDPFLDILLISGYVTHFSISIYMQTTLSLATRFSRERERTNTILYKNDTITLYQPGVLKYPSIRMIL